MIYTKEEISVLSMLERQAYIKGLMDAFNILDTVEIENMGYVPFKGQCMTHSSNINDLNHAFDDRTMMDWVTLALMDVIYNKIEEVVTETFDD